MVVIGHSPPDSWPRQPIPPAYHPKPRPPKQPVPRTAWRKLARLVLVALAAKSMSRLPRVAGRSGHAMMKAFCFHARKKTVGTREPKRCPWQELPVILKKKLSKRRFEDFSRLENISKIGYCKHLEKKQRIEQSNFFQDFWQERNGPSRHWKATSTGKRRTQPSPARNGDNWSHQKHFWDADVYGAVPLGAACLRRRAACIAWAKQQESIRMPIPKN